MLKKLILIKLMKGKALRKHSLYEKNSSLGFIEAVRRQILSHLILSYKTFYVVNSTSIYSLRQAYAQ